MRGPEFAAQLESFGVFAGGQVEDHITGRPSRSRGAALRLGEKAGRGEQDKQKERHSVFNIPFSNCLVMQPDPLRQRTAPGAGPERLPFANEPAAPSGVVRWMPGEFAC